jgi:hypothetical protein
MAILGSKCQFFTLLPVLSTVPSCTVMKVPKFQNYGLTPSFTASTVRPYFNGPCRHTDIAQPCLKCCWLWSSSSWYFTGQAGSAKIVFCYPWQSKYILFREVENVTWRLIHLKIVYSFSTALVIFDPRFRCTQCSHKNSAGELHPRTAASMQAIGKLTSLKVTEEGTWLSIWKKSTVLGSLGIPLL